MKIYFRVKIIRLGYHLTILSVFVLSICSAQSTIEKTIAPDFHYPDINGDTVILSDFIGKYIIIEVWGTWCAPCRKEMPHFEKLIDKYKDENIVFICLSIDSDHEKWKQFVRDKELKGIQLRTNNYSYTDCYFERINGIRVFDIPRFIIIDKQGYIESKKAPRPSSGELEVVLKKLLNEE